MGTNNFYPHENGIFVLKSPDYDEVLEHFKEEGLSEEEITDEMVYSEVGFQEEITVEEFFKYLLKEALAEKGIELLVESFEKATAYRDGRLMAKLELRGGYYSGVQVIVETDPYELLEGNIDLFYNDRIQDYQDDFVKSKLYEEYTPYNATLFKVLEQVTTPLVKLGQFSNGNAVYSVK